MTPKRLSAIVFLLLLFTISLPRMGVDSEICAIVSVIAAIVAGVLLYFFKIRNNITTPKDRTQLKIFYFFIAVSFLISIWSLLAIG